MATPEEKDEVKKEKKKNDAGLVTKESVSAVCALFSALALFVLFTRSAVFGEVGVHIHALLTGLFGYMSYPLFIWFTYLSVFGFLDVSLVKNKRSAGAFTVAVIAIVLIVQTAVGISDGSLASEGYLSACFNAGENFPKLSIAGWVGGLPVYGLTKLVTSVGAIVLLSVVALASVYATAAFAGKNLLKRERKPREKKAKEPVEERVPIESDRACAEPRREEAAFTSQQRVDEPTPMPGYRSGYDPAGMGGYYPFENARVSQRPGVVLSADGRAVPSEENSGVFSPFGATGVGREPQRPLTYEESREILFGSTPAEIYKKNLIFDSNASVNKRPAADPDQPKVTPTPRPVTYSSGYTEAVDRAAQTPSRTGFTDEFTRRVAEPISTPTPAPDAFDFTARRETPPTREDEDIFRGESARREDYSPYELRTETPPARPIAEDPDFGGRSRGISEEGAFGGERVFGGQDAYTLREPSETPTPSVSTEEEKSGEEGYRRHDYMGLFSLSNPRIFGETEEDKRTEAEELPVRDRSSLFDEETETPAVEEPFSCRGDFTREEPFIESPLSRERAIIEPVEETPAPVKREEPLKAEEKTEEKTEEKAAPPPPPKPRVYKPYVRIPLDYFDCTDAEPEANEMEVEHIKRMILGTLSDYKVADATIASVTFGPTVTRYNVVIPRNVSPRKVVALEQEIAIALCSSGVNIYPSFEDGAVSVEVPNKQRQDVLLGCMLSGDGFTKAKPTSLTFAMGKDVANRKIYGDICKMTHLLVAGASGSGKSAFLASLIISLIVKYSPEELRLILIDPKKTEFVLYNSLPHLMINEIITDPSKAVQSLNWAIGEMNRRYGLFEKMSLSGTYVVNLDEYNSHVTKKEEKLPKIVIIVDELADLMLAAKKEMEDRIQNLTQKARAAGIHLVLATQRPSADVITGVIKGNLSTRIAFTVATDVDSRVILDQTGAQKLLGRGDMLYTMSGINTPVRVQGAFIPPSEAQKVVNFIKANNEAFYDEAATAFINNARSGGGAGGGDDFGDSVDESYIAALKVVIQTGGASISMLQRKCSIGFNKAGKIIEWMEMMEYISPFEGSAKARKVLITKEEFERQYGEF
ncbi:MAG: hypothetical protein IJX81_01870 [Clostridia bacterium]|nr:hypothetical protein [Clostridia bacterium]